VALQDNFNAVYNKKEQLKQEKEKIKLHDQLLELELMESLQTLQLDFITKNDKNMLLLPKIKNKLINEIIQANNTKILKKSKYINANLQRAYLLKKYDTITNKTLRIAKIFDKIESEKEAERIQAEYKNTNFVEIPAKKQKKQIDWNRILIICGYIAIIPFFAAWGIISSIIKNKK